MWIFVSWNHKQWICFTTYLVSSTGDITASILKHSNNLKKKTEVTSLNYKLLQPTAKPRFQLPTVLKHLKWYFWIRTHLSQILNLANISYSQIKSFLSGRLNWMSYTLSPCIKAELLQTDSLLSFLSPSVYPPACSRAFSEVKLGRVSSARVSVTTISSVSEGLYLSASARSLRVTSLCSLN